MTAEDTTGKNTLAKLPNMELLVNTADNPLAYHGDNLPIFSFSVDKNHADIMYPAWAFWSGGPAISLYPRGAHKDFVRKLMNFARKAMDFALKMH